MPARPSTTTPPPTPKAKAVAKRPAERAAPRSRPGTAPATEATSPVTQDRLDPAAANSAGKALRQRFKRSAHAELVLPAHRDTVAILEEQHRSRLSSLIGVRVARMLQSPFAFYRGTAAVMAADLAAGPHTGPVVVSCGDAHISNFGFFASPERKLLFDLNDFDEAGMAPWEWDLKRLATSVHVGGRDIGLSEDACRQATQAAVAEYRQALGLLAELSPLERYYFTVDSERVEQAATGKASRKTLDKAVGKASRRTSTQLLERITVRDESGSLRIVDQPPVTRHVTHAHVGELTGLFDQYRATLREDTAWLLDQFRLADFVLRIVGVGSVGTRCYVIALEAPDSSVLFLQAKEAQASVLTSYGGCAASIPGAPASTAFTEGHRVIAGQRILQAHSDPFLGYIIGWAGEQQDRPRVDYYWRQFRDMKGSIDPSTLDGEQFVQYGRLCGRLLARAHSQTRVADVAAAYLGDSERFDEAIATWSAAYADVCEADYEAVRRAVDNGRLPFSPEN